MEILGDVTTPVNRLSILYSLSYNTRQRKVTKSSPTYEG
jgi:hypothetical protein